MNEVTKLTARDFATGQEVRWCPGCVEALNEEVLA
jgi:2-oxoglutarate ferredoxin oxidoreductase subunit beta